MRAWRPIRPLDFRDGEGRRRMILRLAFLFAYIFEVEKWACDEKVVVGSAPLVRASYSLFGRGFYDVELYGLWAGASWRDAARCSPRRQTRTTLGILGAVARARASIRDGRYRSRWAALVFYHLTTRPLAFVDAANTAITSGEREALILFNYLRRVYAHITVVRSRNPYVNRDVEDLLARYHLGPVRWADGVPPASDGPVVALDSVAWPDVQETYYEVFW